MKDFSPIFPFGALSAADLARIRKEVHCHPRTLRRALSAHPSRSRSTTRIRDEAFKILGAYGGERRLRIEAERRRALLSAPA